MKTITTLTELAKLADYSFLASLNPDPKANKNGDNYYPREVFSGHYVPVKPTPIENPKYITHSKTFFNQLGFDDSLAKKDEFIQVFSGDISNVPKPLKTIGWACGYALSIYGTEYYDQCPFKSGNGYGDGRAISVLEAVIDGKRWEMQLKGGGKTPYCRGADGKAVLRSSIREFLAQELMYALRVPTSRSLSLYTSTTQSVKRPWFNQGSYSRDPELMIDEPVAISTRVAPSFIRVGQVELFARRSRKNEHPKALEELKQIVLHVIDREYSDLIDTKLPLEEKVILLATEFRGRLTSLVANWIRIGYCQGNFNSDNCAVGGFTLDYGPFGFIDMFDPEYQPWTGGGIHFSFFNQPQAAALNFNMFCKALEQLIKNDQNTLDKLQKIKNGFSKVMKEKLEKMWATKLGTNKFDPELTNELILLIMESSVDYTIFFRELSNIPDEISPLVKSFYDHSSCNEELFEKWSQWLEKWRSHIKNTNPLDINTTTPNSHKKLSHQMKQVNPKYTLREWLLVPAYQKATNGDYSLIKELQEVMTHPYNEQSSEIEKKYYQQKPSQLFGIAGISHISCSS